jgi:hypothetical protein
MTTPIAAGAVLTAPEINARLVVGTFAAGNNGNNATETVIGTLTIPPNDAEAGSIYHYLFKGTVTTGTTAEVLNIQAKFNNTSGSTLFNAGAQTAAASITIKDWHVDGYLYCSASGSTGVWYSDGVLYSQWPSSNTITHNGRQTISQDTTVAIPIVVTTDWTAVTTGYATSTIYGFCERVQ